MKYLIVGLGNPGAQYEGNRHNIGFMAVDELAALKKEIFSQDRHGYACTIRLKGKQVTLLKPTTYMNLSGKALRYHMQKLGVPPQNVLVVTDDIALPYGKIRLRPKGSHGGHNGLRNIQEVLGNNEYARLRFGVGDDFRRGGQADYVLANFKPEEQKDLDLHISKLAEGIIAFVNLDISRAMTQVN